MNIEERVDKILEQFDLTSQQGKLDFFRGVDKRHIPGARMLVKKFNDLEKEKSSINKIQQRIMNRLEKLHNPNVIHLSMVRAAKKGR